MSSPKLCSAGSPGELLRLVAGGYNPYDDGPVVIRVGVWDGRVVVGTYYDGQDKPDLYTDESVIEDFDSLGMFLEDLLGGRREHFVTTTGRGDMVCVLCWTLEQKETIAA